MAKNSKKPNPNKSRDWIIRIIVFGALGIVLVLALLDYQAKQQASETATAWNELLKNANENEAGILPLKDLNRGIVGSPERTENASGNTTTLTYTWNGTFRKYEVEVSATSAEDYARVNGIKGPGKGDEEE